MSKYDRVINGVEKNTTYGAVLPEIREGAAVLECGCADGYMTRYMKEQLHTRNYIVEIDPESFESAKPYAEGGVCADLEREDWTEAFQGMQFDVILMMDVLEHLSDPLSAVKRAKTLLREDGRLIATIPNIAHDDIVRKLLQNRWDYTDTGLLDRTHIHFWGQKNILPFFEEAELFVERVDRIYCEVGGSEQGAVPFPDPRLGLLLSDRADSTVYEYIVMARTRSHAERNGLKEYEFSGDTGMGRLYYSRTMGSFSGEEYVRLELNRDRLCARVELPRDGGYRYFRFDPVESFGCLCRSVAVKLGGKTLSPTISNGFRMGEWDVFTTQDPAYYFESDAPVSGQIEVCAEVYPVDISAFSPFSWAAMSLKEQEETVRQREQQLLRETREKAAFQTKVEMLEQLGEEARREKEELQSAVVRLERDSAVRDGQLGRLREEKAQLAAANKELRSRCDELTETRGSLEKKVNRLLDANDELEMKVTSEQVERENYRQEALQLRHHIEETKKSISWRIAEPIRWLGRVLRRNAKGPEPVCTPAVTVQEAAKDGRDLWAELEETILSIPREYVDIFPVPMGWNTPLFQRFQHISLQTGKLNGIAFYGAHPKVDPEVETYRFVSPRLCIVNLEDPEVVEHFWKIMDRLTGLKIIRVQSIDLATPMERIEGWLKKGYQVVYEYIDEITPSITGTIPEFILSRHEKILREERISVVATSRKLYDQAAAFRKNNIQMLTNGVDYDHWHIARPEDCPEELEKAVESGKIIVGYHGALAQWVDYELLRAIAEDGRYFLVLIGFAHDESLKKSGVLNCPNTAFLGAKSYQELNRYAAFYDIGILPFLINDITLSVSPVKIFEYMAAGKPVVTYALPECKKYKSCLCAETREEFLAQLEAAGELRQDETYRKQLDSDAQANTWLAIADAMVEAVRDKYEREQDNGGGRTLMSFMGEEAVQQYTDQILKIPTFREEAAFRELTDSPYEAAEGDCKIIAYYLTQFHPDAHNEKWWGRGVTEWNNVCRAVPQYVGHYQPRLPGELGFYDLRIAENIERQIELAKMYGIYGFSFYYYWFDGERLLEKPLEMFLKNKELRFPFSLCWANENWTRRFDGTNTGILMEQPKTVESYKNVIEDIGRFLTDERYIRVNGKKLLTVYRPSLMPDAREVIAHWRRYCRKNGLGELYLLAVKENGVETDWLRLGFDALTEFHPGTLYSNLVKKNDEMRFVRRDFSGEVYSYPDIVTNQKYFRYDYPKLYRAVMPMWDNTARRNNKGMILDGSEPALYKQWLKDVIRAGAERTDLEDNMIFINAWNEWGEGAYLEPDKRYGYAYLQATKEAVEESRPSAGADAPSPPDRGCPGAGEE